jgi:hypothetical protein
MKTVRVESPAHSNISFNTQALLDEAEHQRAMSALNESFLSRLSMKPTTRTALHHKIKWDGQDTTFPLFKKQYKAYLLASQQDYAADPEFRRAYIDQSE